MRRTLGWLSIGGAVCAAVLAVLLLFAGGAALFSAVIAMGEVKTPTEGGAQNIENLMRTAGIIAIAAGVTGVLQLLLDLAVGVLGVLALSRPPRALPVILLVSVLLVTVLPLALAGSAWLAGQADLTDLAGWLWIALSATILVVLPAARLAEFITGIVTAVIGDRPMSAVSPHP